MAITLTTDPVANKIASSRMYRVLSGRASASGLASVKQQRPGALTRLIRSHVSARRRAISQLSRDFWRAGAALSKVAAAVQAGGGHPIAVEYAGPTLIAQVPARQLRSLIRRTDVRAIEPQAPRVDMGGLANETAAVGTSTWWQNNHVGGTGTADTVPGNLAIMDDKIDETQPLLAGLNFERPLGTTSSPKCGQSTAGCEHGTEVAGMAVATGNSTCTNLCSADTGSERGVAYGVAHVLDADFTTTPDSAACLFDSGIWALGVSEPPIGSCSHAMPGAPDPTVIHSDSHGSYTTDDDSAYEQNLDKLVSTYGVIETEPSGNDGLSGAGSGHITDSCVAYDVICVGGIGYNDPTTASDDAIASFSSEGPSPLGRKKPDIVAVAAGSAGGGNMTVLEQRYTYWNRLERGDTGTSFASPQVAGGAALLYGAGITDPLTVKAVLLDSATLGRATPSDPMGTQTGWQPDWGWGELNLDAAYQQRYNFVADSVTAQAVRFYRATAAPGDRATLVWNRRVGGPLDQTAVPRPLTLSNLDLYEYDTSQNLLAQSTSSIDNVEQVRAPAAGTVVYKVKDESSTVDGASAEPFTVAAKDALTPLLAPTPELTLTLDRSAARQGDDVTVTATSTNPSADIVGSSTQIDLTLPPGVEVVTNDSGTTSSTWTPGTVAPGATSSYHWTVRGTQDGVARLTVSARDQAYGETFSARGASAQLAVDSTPPTTSIDCRHDNVSDPQVRVSWNAADASPIGSYDVDVSADGGPFISWLGPTTQTSAIYDGQPGHSYSFRVRARDTLGNESPVQCGPVVVGFVPVSPVGPLGPAAPALPVPAHLRVSKVTIRGSRLTVRGALARGARGSVSGSYSARGGRPARARARVFGGRYQLIFRLGARLRRAKRGLLRLAYSGDRSYAAQRIIRRVTPQRLKP